MGSFPHFNWYRYIFTVDSVVDCPRLLSGRIIPPWIHLVPEAPALRNTDYLYASIACVPLTRLIAQLQGGLLWEALEAKQGSIEGHTFPWALWTSKWVDWVLLGEWKYTHYESWFAAAMINFGLLWLAVYAILIMALSIYLRRAYLKAKPESKPVYAGLFLFSCYFAFGSFNLPLPLIFPINALFFLFAFLVAFGKVEAHDCAAPHRKLELSGALAKAARE